MHITCNILILCLLQYPTYSSSCRQLVVSKQVYKKKCDDEPKNRYNYGIPLHLCKWRCIVDDECFSLGYDYQGRICQLFSDHCTGLSFEDGHYYLEFENYRELVTTEATPESMTTQSLAQQNPGVPMNPGQPDYQANPVPAG